MVMKVKSWVKVVLGFVTSLFILSPQSTLAQSSASQSEVKSKGVTSSPVRVSEPTEGHASKVEYVLKKEGRATVFEAVSEKGSNTIGINIPAKLESINVNHPIEIVRPAVVTDVDGSKFIILPLPSDETELIEKYENAR